MTGADWQGDLAETVLGVVTLDEATLGLAANTSVRQTVPTRPSLRIALSYSTGKGPSVRRVEEHFGARFDADPETRDGHRPLRYQRPAHNNLRDESDCLTAVAFQGRG